MVKTLQETVELMNSSDYKDRFKAEYYQLAYRIEKLHDMVEKWNDLSFDPICDKVWYIKQLYAMNEYKDILEMRAEKEDIEL